MNQLERMENFESSWADRHDIPEESLPQYRHATQEGYRLPDMAKNYRTWCLALDSFGFNPISADELVILGYLNANGVEKMKAGRLAFVNRNATPGKAIPVFIHQSNTLKTGE